MRCFTTISTVAIAMVAAATTAVAQPALTFSQARSILDPPECREDAAKALERQGYGELETRSDYVLASKTSVRAMISCLPAGDRTLRTIVVTGESGDEARVEHDALGDRLSVFDSSVRSDRLRASAGRSSPSADRDPGPGVVEATARISLPPPAAIDWSRSAVGPRGPDAWGSVERYACPPRGEPGPVWGTTVYADGSSICTAAVHAGLVDLASGGDVTIVRQPGEPEYRGSLRHGIRSLDAGAGEGSFVVVRTR